MHAQIILLTYFPDASADPSVKELYSTLLDWWFAGGNSPAAYLLLSKEEAVLIPDWLKLKMIRSDCPILVDTALRELEPHQLVLFIQSFGIPVNSMSKLLAALDRAAATSLPAVSVAVMDKVSPAAFLVICRLVSNQSFNFTILRRTWGSSWLCNIVAGL